MECLKIRRGIITSPNGFEPAPFDASLTRRVEWLTINVINPIERLKTALEDSNRPHFHHWEEYGETSDRDRQPILDELNALRVEAISISRWLESEIDGSVSGKVRHTDEIRYFVVYTALSALEESFPELTLSRGNWDEALGIATGAVPDFVRRVFLETTGQHEQLDGPIQSVITDTRKLQQKSR
ncbi:hypothetical protein [Agrobacterium rosae]|uniref:hypothetical protein n=1 Tax=Agrobacterium rosae TaxID=1972867 RepID=UPI003BA07826